MVLPEAAMGTRTRDTLRKATRHSQGRTRLHLGPILLHQGLTPLHLGHTHHSMGILLSMVVIHRQVTPVHLTRGAAMVAAMVAWGWGLF